MPRIKLKQRETSRGMVSLQPNSSLPSPPWCEQSTSIALLSVPCVSSAALNARLVLLFVALTWLALHHAQALEESSVKPIEATAMPPRISANLGENVILKCAFEFANQIASPYVIHWYKNGEKRPIYIFYDGFPTHLEDEYKGRMSLLDKANEASLNLTSVRDTDQGLYECKVFFLLNLNGKQNSNSNGTRILLEVNSPPHFKEKPPSELYPSLGESVKVRCHAHGTPTPTVTWKKVSRWYVSLYSHMLVGDQDNTNVVSSDSLHVHGGEMHIKSLKESDTGTYVCVAHNFHGSMEASTRILLPVPAEIVNPPRNTTVIEKNSVEMSCAAKGVPKNITYRWFHKGILISELAWLSPRIEIKSDGTLVIKTTTADDSGKFTCDVSNNIGEPDTASAHLSVEFPARVTYSPARQYLPLGMSGIIKCHIQASPALQFATWTKDRRTFDPSTQAGVELLANGSLFISRVSHEHQGFYRCTPFNIQGTSQSSNAMEIIVREPPVFKVKPSEYYVASVEDDVTMSCEGMGNPKPTIVWRKLGNGNKLPKERTFIRNGNITMTNLRKEDFGKYECILKNEIATLVAHTYLRMNGTTPYPPTNVSVSTSASAATIMWVANFDGGLSQHFTIRYRLAEDDDETGWKTMRVMPPEAKAFSIYNLKPESEYQFQVFAANQLGRGSGSEIIKAKTKSESEVALKSVPSSDPDTSQAASPTVPEDELNLPTVLPDPLSTSFFPTSLPSSSVHDKARNVSIEKMAQGWVVSWLPPNHPEESVAYYRVEYKEGDSNWIESPSISKDNAYLIKDLKGSVKYTFRVVAYSILGRQTHSDLVEYKLVNINTNLKGPRAITAGIVGSVLFFVAAIILSVCTVKICNKRKQRKMEKAYMMVTCPVMDGVNGTHSHHSSPVALKQIAQANKKDLHKAEYQV